MFQYNFLRMNGLNLNKERLALILEEKKIKPREAIQVIV